MCSCRRLAWSRQLWPEWRPGRCARELWAGSVSLLTEPKPWAIMVLGLSRDVGGRGLRMPWIGEHRNLWRGAILVLVLMVIRGPRAFDLIWVPSAYTCSPPTVRLHDDYCGVPVSGIRILVWKGSAWANASLGLAAGAMPALEAARKFPVSLLLFLLALPVFSSLHLILRGDRWRWQLFSVVA